jgi:cobalt-precorrin-5B (C1)-methyltransferase
MMVMVPGNIGRRAVEKRFRFAPEQLLETGNAWDDAFELARPFGFRAFLVAGHPGKIAKLVHGPVDTHSARSGTAADILRGILADIDPEAEAAGETAEAIFSSSAPALSRRLAETCAERVRSALRETGAAAEVAVWLCGLEGNELGHAGDLTPWG